MWTHRSILVAASQRDLAAQLCSTLAGPGGSNMFTTPLSPSGAEPATHYISSGLIEDNFAALLPLDAMVDDVWTRISDGMAQMVVDLYNEAKPDTPITLAQVGAVFAGSDVSEQEPLVAMARLGLQIVTPPDA